MGKDFEKYLIEVMYFILNNSDNKSKGWYYYLGFFYPFIETNFNGDIFQYSEDIKRYLLNSKIMFESETLYFINISLLTKHIRKIKLEKIDAG